MKNEKVKYVIFADGKSPHTLKWVRELILYYDVFIISSSHVSQQIKELVRPENYFELGIKVNTNGSTKAFLKKVFSLNSLIKKISPDIVNAHYISSHGFLIALIKQFGYSNFKFVASAWGTDVLVFPFQNKLYYWIMRFVLSKADFITSDSNYMSEVIQRIRNKEVMTFTFGLQEMPGCEIDKKDNNLYFSNRALSDNYNIDQVIRVFKDIKETGPESKLIISNDGPEKENLKKLVQELGLEDSVEFSGFLNQDDQAKIYARATYYLSLPTSDSTSVSLLEALAFGCIPILSDIPANREWVNHGENGLLIVDKIDITKLTALNKKQHAIIESNRNLIAEKGLFPKLMKDYVEGLKK